MNPYFERKEFACKCGCGKVELDALFLSQLEQARDIAGVPFVITSGYRCPAHNAKVGSTSRNHTSGRAADIAAATGPVRGRILTGLVLAGFRRIGIGPTFIHADSMDDVDSCWLYGG